MDDLTPGTPDRLRRGLAEHGLVLLGEIGRGGTAVVYRARDLKHERDVAVKVLRPELAQTLSGGRFMREIQLLAHLHHPVIHRDIKPGNVLLTAGHAVVSDFGIAAAVSRAEAEQRGTERLTGAGVGVGTAEYVSPEQAHGAPLDARSDIYSLGCVMYEMLLGRPPFTGRDPVEVVRRRLSETPVPPRERRPDVPDWLERAVMQALARDPSARCASAGDLARVLHAYSLPAAVSDRPGGPPVPRRSGSRWGARSIGFSLLGLGVLALVPMLIGGGESPPRPSRVRVATLANETGDTALAAIGRRAADRMTAAVFGVSNVEVIAPRRPSSEGLSAEAATVIAGAYYGSRDSVEFRVTITDAASGRVLRAIGPIWTSASRPEAGLEQLSRAVATAIETMDAPASDGRVPARSRRQQEHYPGPRHNR